MSLHYKIHEVEEPIQYVDVLSPYPYVCKYFIISIGHLSIHFGDACQNREAILR